MDRWSLYSVINIADLPAVTVYFNLLLVAQEPFDKLFNNFFLAVQTLNFMIAFSMSQIVKFTSLHMTGFKLLSFQ